MFVLSIQRSILHKCHLSRQEENHQNTAMPQNQSTERHWCLKAATSHNNGIKTALIPMFNNNSPTLCWNPLPVSPQIISLRDKTEAFYFTISSQLRAAVIQVLFKEDTAVLTIVKPETPPLYGQVDCQIPTLSSFVFTKGCFVFVRLSQNLIGLSIVLQDFVSWFQLYLSLALTGSIQRNELTVSVINSCNEC